MSVKIMGAAWDLAIPAAKLIVLLAMADHADHNGENVFPSVELLAWKTGYSESQTRRIMKLLVADGILVPQLRPGKTTLYSLHLDKGKQKPPFIRRNKGMQNDTPGGSTAMTPQDSHSYDTPGGSTAMTPEPSLEPSNNHIASGDAKKTVASEFMTPMKNAIAEVFHYDWKKMSDTEKGCVQKAARELCLAEVTPSEIPDLFNYCSKEFTKFKATALAGNISEWRNAQPKASPAVAFDLSKWTSNNSLSFLDNEG